MTDSFGDELWSIFSDLSSHLSSNICNDGKTFNFSSGTDFYRTNFLVLMHLNLVMHFLRFCCSGFLVSLAPPMLFMIHKPFAIAGRSHVNRKIPPDTRETFSLKNIPSCLLAVACFMAMSIPAFVNFGLRMNSMQNTLNYAYVIGIREWKLSNA